SFASELWYGIRNLTEEKNEKIIQQFNGLGKDANGDGLADLNNEEDLLYSYASYIASYGLTRDDFKIALFNHYQRDLAVKTIMSTARIFKHIGKIYLHERSFPL